MHPFEILADGVRRHVLVELAAGERPAGALVEAARERFGISQPAVSQHLRVLREGGFVSVRAEGTRRVYAARPEAFDEAAAALDALRPGAGASVALAQRLDALHTEIRRGARERRREERETERRSTA